LRLYHKFLGLFFDFDFGIYALSKPKINSNRVFDFKFDGDLKSNSLVYDNFPARICILPKPKIIVYSNPSLMQMLKMHDFSSKLFPKLIIRDEKMFFPLILHDYNVEISQRADVLEEKLPFCLKLSAATEKEINISRSLKTFSEILEVEPYTKKYSIKKILNFPIRKYPVKKEKFSEEQLEFMRTKLAIQAKCKKYSINVESVYDKFPEGLYEEVKIEKDGSISCKLSNKANFGDLQILAVGKRRYDTQNTSVYIKYSELRLENA